MIDFGLQMNRRRKVTAGELWFDSRLLCQRWKMESLWIPSFWKRLSSYCHRLLGPEVLNGILVFVFVWYWSIHIIYIYFNNISPTRYIAMHILTLHFKRHHLSEKREIYRDKLHLIMFNGFVRTTFRRRILFNGITLYSHHDLNYTTIKLTLEPSLFPIFIF